MDAVRLEERLRLGEDSRVEFKSVARSQFDVDIDDLARSVAALANTGGGHVILGAENDGTPTGVGSVAQADRLMVKASQACRERLRPPIACAFVKVVSSGVPLLVIEIPAFTPERPYLVHGKLYMRDGARTVEGSGADMRRIAQSIDYHFDEQPVRGASREDLDLTAVEEFLRSAYGRSWDAEEAWIYLQRALGCLDEEGVPTVAGVLVFGRQPERWLPEARISAVRFPGTEASGSFIDRQEIGGRLTDQFRGTVTFLSKHLMNPSRVEGGARTEHGIPADVLREAILNALAHRDYRMASQTRIFLFDDRVEISNPGDLLNRLTIESIKAGIGQRRNPRVAALLAVAHSERRENLGLGIRLMVRLMRERGLPEPMFTVDAGHFRVVLKTS
ncbi:MAG TPA: ATP-binding protein [Candidatus Acidoferrum sp.]|nr:ATP-binding protein [Candidatus Acidoferrum sp.]